MKNVRSTFHIAWHSIPQKVHWKNSRCESRWKLVQVSVTTISSEPSLIPVPPFTKVVLHNVPFFDELNLCWTCKDRMRQNRERNYREKTQKTSDAIFEAAKHLFAIYYQLVFFSFVFCSQSIQFMKWNLNWSSKWHDGELLSISRGLIGPSLFIKRVAKVKFASEWRFQGNGHKLQQLMTKFRQLREIMIR